MKLIPRSRSSPSHSHSPDVSGNRRTVIGWEKIAPGEQSSYQIYNDRAFDARPSIVADVNGMTMDAPGQIDYTEPELAPGRHTFLVYALPTARAPDYEPELGVMLLEE